MGHMVPGAAGLFGVFQLGLSHANKHQVCITLHLHDHLTDFIALPHNIAQCTTCFSEIMPDYPLVIGSVDAVKPGMGGVLFTPGQPPAMWQATFLEDVHHCIISMENPTPGDLMNSDLEQARVLAHADIATLLFDL